MKHAPFVHLHLHSEYSLLDGAIRFSEVLGQAHTHRMPALAVTDHGNLYGAISFYKQARKAGIKPIIGCEVYVASGSRLDRTPARSPQEGNHHLLLLAQNAAGYKNLLRLVTSGHLEGFYYKPRVDKKLILEHHHGLIAMSACLHGEIPRLLMDGQVDRAREVTRWYMEAFPGRFYLEIMDNGIPQQSEVNQGLIRLSGETGAPLVATNDCHYLRREDARAHDVLLCIQTGKSLGEASRLRFQTDQFYFKSPEEMARAFADVPEALANTIVIAEQCNLEMDLGHFHFPRFPLPPGESLEERLEDSALRGFQDRMEEIRQSDPEWSEAKADKYRERLTREIEVIQGMGFSGYFLIVADFIGHARQQGIAVGPGRGSAAGSLVAYSLRITDIDPIRYNLLFERFLNPERRSMPDIDIDFCKLRRDEVIRYVGQRYGEENVAQITTFGRMEARAVVRDVGRVLGMTYDEVDRIAKLIPKGLKINLEKAMAQEPRLGELAKKDPRVAGLLDVARALEGLVRHASTHAAGVVISDRPIVEHVPLYRSQEGELVTQYDMKAVEEIGLIKFDFLGLRTLTMMEDATRLLRRRGVDLDLRHIPLDDAETYSLLSSGETDGIFQLESSGMRDLLTRMRPSVFDDLIALVALYRPGPLGSGMIDDFIGRKQGKVPIRYELPQLAPILRDTYGVIVYQEQVMQIAAVLAGYSMGQADVLRKAMGKKITSVMEEQKQFFLAGAQKGGVPKDVAGRIFELISKFGEYGFNKSHSAAYALVSYETAYLKAHHPVEFMAALLTSEKEKTDKVIRYIGACRSQDIEVLPPDVNESEWDFSVSEGKIRFGLGGVKNVGRKAIDSILEAREEGGAFRSLQDFCQRVDLQKVNRRVVESLIKCGAFDSFGGHRAQFMALVDRVMDESQKLQKIRARGQMTMFSGLGNGGEPGMGAPPLSNVPQWTDQQRLESEKETLGFYVTGHPLGRILKQVSAWTNANTETLPQLPDKGEVRLVGMKRASREVTTKKGERMGFITLEDLKGSVEVVCFPDSFRKALPLIQEDRPLCVRGTVEHGEEQSKIIAADVLSLEEVRVLEAPPFHVVLRSQRMRDGDLQGLRNVLQGHPGGRSLRIHIVLEGGEVAVLEPPEGFRVEPGEGFVAHIREIMGDRVELRGV
jgi:DNA polymerase III subunit alpha